MKLILTFFFLTVSFTVQAEEALKGASSDVQEITVTAPRIKNSVESLLEIRKQKTAVADVLGQEAMTRNGDTDAAASLRRVTGLTLVNGKFVYVRGLGERYSSVLLNGSQVPSPEPTRRVVPLDLFPVTILESITVQKSFSPDRPAEFGGGLIELQTRTIPKQFTGQMSTGVNSTNFQPGLSYKGGETDYLGFDDGTRKLPSVFRSAFRNGKKIIEGKDGFTEEQLLQMTKSLPVIYNTQTSSSEAPPNMQFSLGDSKKFAKGRAGALLGFNYGSSSDIGTRSANTYNVGAGNQLILDEKSKSKFAQRDIQLGGSLDTGFEWKDTHQIKVTSMLLRSSTNLTQERIAEQSSDSFPLKKYTNLQWNERELLFNQLTGEHKATDFMTVKWRLNQSKASLDNPDNRQYMRKWNGNAYELETDVSGNRRIYSQLTDKTNETGLDTDFKLRDKGESKINLKVGMMQNNKDRLSDVYRLHLKDNYPVGGQPDLTQDTETILRQDGFIVTSITDAADSFAGNQRLLAYYSNIDWSPNEKWTFSLGARREDSVQKVKTYKYYDPTQPTSRGNLHMNDILPAYNLTWKLNKEERVRLAYGETLARPDFRELSTVAYIEDETGYQVVGNSDLKGTVIKNWDLRYERYSSDSDYFSIGGFYKKFQSPIEAVFQPGDKLFKTYQNSPTATNFGIETEGRVSLRKLARNLRRWTIASNVSYIKSEVQINSQAGNQTSDRRPLQGQSPYVANLQLLYDRPFYKITSGLIYNVVGKRITEVGTNQRPDIYEQPFQQLDFVFNQNFGSWGYGLRARNLLNPESKSTQGNEVVRSRYRGRSYVANITAYF